MIYIHNNLLDELKQPGGVRLALQRAIELEHATLPTYLYSYYSLGSDFNKPLASLMFSVIFEEMLHFCIACNVLNAIGGSPCIDKPDFIPTFPGRLPGGVETKLKVHLKKFSKQHVKNTFMEIEEPEKPIEPPIRTMTAGVPAAEINLTIGQYYQAILGELENQPFHGDPSKQVVRVFPNAELFPVTDFYSARKAIVIIADQGEGTSLDAFDAEGDPAHYYRFEEIFLGKTLHRVKPPPPPGSPVDKHFFFGPPEIPFDPLKVINVVDDPKQSLYPITSPAHQLNINFNYAYTSMLKSLHLTFNGHQERLESAIGLMHSMRELALEMMTVPVVSGGTVFAGPSFEYQPVNS